MFGYTVFQSVEDCDDYVDVMLTDPYQSAIVRDRDEMLHRALQRLFRNYTSEEIRQLVRSPAKRTSIFENILKLEPALGQLFEKRINISLLWFVVLNNFEKSAELLVRSGADVNELYGLDCDEPGLSKESTLLHALCQMYPSSWNDRFIGLILDHGADLQARDVNSTVLHKAISNNRVEVTEMLLEKGADVNAVDHGCSVLHKAALCHKVNEIFPLLLKYGADIQAKDANGENILYKLSLNCFVVNLVDLARDLIKTDSDPTNHPIHTAVALENIELINLYLDHGANVNALYSSFNRFPLYDATKDCKNIAVLQILLKRGANIDLRTIEGYTALHSLTLKRSVSYWCKELTLKKIKILLSVGADMFAEDDSGFTPFEYIQRVNMNNPSIRLMLKTLALKKAHLQPSIELEGEKFFKEYPVLWNYYEDCLEEIDRIKSTKFVMTGTLFELLTNCQCQIIKLMRYREFNSKFRLYDLSDFPMFAEDMLEAFKCAEQRYILLLQQEYLINQATYYRLPYLIVRQAAAYTANCELCEMKNAVLESRRANKETA